MSNSPKLPLLFVFACLWRIASLSGCYAEDPPKVVSITVTPHRIELGSLEFGREESAPVQAHLDISGIPPGVRIVDVDCSHAPGVCVFNQSFDHDKAVVNLEINQTKLCASEPFGAFIKREIRLETDSPTEPQFVVPIIGWVDINNTPRDFNQFVFEGIPRWKGIWATPNVAGAMLAASSLSLIGMIAWFQQRLREYSSRWAAAGLFPSIAGITVTLILLGQTYSRGAWLAAFIALGALIFCSRSLRKISIFATTVLAIILLLLPCGAQRLESFTTMHDDLSIANRVRLWQGAFQIMADHPFTGVGSGQFEPAFERDYQTFGHTAKTSTAVSDYLTLGSEHGLFVLSLTLGFLLTLLISSLGLAIKSHWIPIQTLSAILMGILITSAFSTMCVVPDYQCLSVITVLALTGCTVILGVRERGVRSFTLYSLIRISKCTIATLIVLFLVSVTCLTRLPTRSSIIQLGGHSRTIISYQAFEPRWKAARGIILFLADCSHPEALYHSTIRPVAAMGWEVVAIPDTTDPALLHSLVDSFHQAVPKVNLFVAGDSNGGRVAWKISSQESRNELRAGGGFNFLSTDLDDRKHRSGPRQPFLVYQSLYSDGVSSNASICAQNKVAFVGMPLTVILSKDNINRFSEGWMTFLITLSDFFEHENLYASNK